MKKLFGLLLLLVGLPVLAAVHYIRAAATNENNFQIEVTTSTSPQNFICKFVSPGTLHVDWGDTTTDDFNTTITNTHTYATAGIYTIRMSGHVHNIDFFVLPDPGTGTPDLITAIKTPIRGVDGLITALEMFKHGHNIPTIPVGMFDSCTNITSFYDAFLACNSLQYIPTNLFHFQTNVTSFYGTFKGCTTLTSIPAELFYHATNNLNFNWTFQGCTGLMAIPDLLFSRCPDVTSYAYCFRGCTSLDGNTPHDGSGNHLWELTPEPTGTLCFGSDTGLDDYASIPADWK